MLLRSGIWDMNVLISLGTALCFLYSLVAADLHPWISTCLELAARGARPRFGKNASELALASSRKILYTLFSWKRRLRSERPSEAIFKSWGGGGNQGCRVDDVRNPPPRKDDRMQSATAFVLRDAVLRAPRQVLKDAPEAKKVVDRMALELKLQVLTLLAVYSPSSLSLC